MWERFKRELQELFPQSSESANRLINDCKGKSFLEFNNVIGLPRKDEPDQKDVEHPIYDYEIGIVNNILSYQHNWIKKSRGLGVTEIILRLFAWLSLSSDYYNGKFFHIVTGTKEQFAAKLIVRLENILKRNYPDINFDSKYTELKLNRTIIEAFPTKQLKDLRGHVNVSYMFIDEADYFDFKEQQELPYVIKSYEEKSNAKIIMVSTPNRPDGLFHAIEEGLAFNGFFHLMKLNYQVGLDKIYNRKFIEREMLEPEFEREYNLKYLGRIGNVFLPSQVEKATILGEQYKDRPINQYTQHLGGIDPGWGKITPVYVAEVMKEEKCLRIIHYKGFKNSTPEEVGNYIHKLSNQFTNIWWLIDGSDRGFINTLKTKFEEPQDWEDEKDVSPRNNRIIPVNFTKHHKELLEHLFTLLAGGHIAIPLEYDRLLTALRTAQATEWSLNKEETVNDDDLDDLRLLVKPFNYGGIT